MTDKTDGKEIIGRGAAEGDGSGRRGVGEGEGAGLYRGNPRTTGGDRVTRSWSGAAQAGSREYTDVDAVRVLERLPHGRSEATSLRTFIDSLAMDARTVRAILADRDGSEFVGVYDGELFYAAEFAEETRPHTDKLRARARAELERVGRRERYAATLPRRQEMMAL